MDFYDLTDDIEPVSYVIGSQDDSDDDMSGEVLYGVLRGEIVGIRYYKGTVNNKEMVSLVREPHNRYDPNAVKVNNLIGEQVGHIKKELAYALSFVMDRKLARVEGVVPFGSTNVYTMPVDLTLYGRPENKNQAVNKLRTSGFPMYEGLSEIPAGSGKSMLKSSQSSGSGKYESPAVARKQLGPAEMKNEMDKLFENLEEGDKMSECDPCSAIVTPLFSHQRKALSWMIRAENDDGLPPFWVFQAGNYFNSVANFTTKKRPDPIKGGILADDMGLGKTLEIIALILTNFERGQPLAHPVQGQTRPSKIAKQERLELYRRAAKEQEEKNKARSVVKLEDSNGCFSLSSQPIRKPLVLIPSPQNVKAVLIEKVEEKSAILEKPSLTALQDTTLISNPPAPVAKKVFVIKMPVLPGKVMLPKISKDPEYICKEEMKPMEGLPSLNVLSRPKRTIRKPANYGDSGDEEEMAAKKLKIEQEQPILVELPDLEITVPSANANVKQKPAGRGRRKAAAKNSVSSSSSFSAASEFVPQPAMSNSSSAVSQDGSAWDSAVTISDDELPDLELLEVPDPAQYAQNTPISDGRVEGTGPRPTLIICPLSTLSNWLDQIEQHVDERVLLKVYTYYGNSRTTDFYELSQQDIVLTTYQTLTADAKSFGSLQKVHWLRIVLDEGHTIRNPSAQMTKAVLELVGDRKWVVTGTPIQNSVKDLWPLMNFLNVRPLEDRIWWTRMIESPLMRGDTVGIKRIKGLLGMIAMRRVKTQEIDGKPLVELPSRDVFVETIRLSEEERKIYDAMQDEGKVIVSKYCRQGTLLNHYGEVMTIMMRLRQMCLHPSLIAKSLEAAQKLSESSENYQPEEFRKMLIEKILVVLSSGSNEECPICLDGLKTPVITHCAHVFCRPCIEEVINSEHALAKCPMCRGQVSLNTLVEVPPDYKRTEDSEAAGDQPWHSSSKVDSLMHALIQLREDDASIKSIVVSQFTSFLSILEKPLRENGFHFVRLDGTMSGKRRVAAIEAFSDANPGGPTIFLLSLKAGGVGINLTAASRVFLMDPAWNPAAEEQCFDRCHRLGQTRPVVITKFVVESSIEEKMIALQDKKRALAQGIFGEHKQTADQIRESRIKDIKALMDL